MHRRRTLDAEVVDLFRDEPELLAVADAVAATQRPRSRRAHVVAGVFVASAIAAAASILTFSGGRESLVDKALAAVGGAPVVHIVLERRVPNDVVVDLRTGRVASSSVSVESWFDSRTRSLRILMRRNGSPVPATPEEAAAAGAQLAALDPGTLSFLRDYRDALQARRVRTASADERVLELRGSRSGGKVRLGSDYRPIAFLPNGRRSEWRVVVFRGEVSVPAREALGVAEGVRGRVVAGRRASVRAARDALGGSVLLLRLPELSRRSLLVERLVRHARRTTTTLGVRVRYEGRGGFVDVLEAGTPEPAYSFADARMTIGMNPIPAAGSVDVHRPSDGRVWIGQLRRGKLFLTLRAPSRDLLVAAARSLYPGVA